jgi:hypothetical protein
MAKIIFLIYLIVFYLNRKQQEKYERFYNDESNRVH